MNSAYYRGADGCIIVYDASAGEDQTANVQSWLKELFDYLPETIPIWILGNKVDLAKERGLSMKQYPMNCMARFAKKQGYVHYFTSAKDDEDGLIEIFDQVSVKLWPKLKARYLRANPSQ